VNGGRRICNGNQVYEIMIPNLLAYLFLVLLGTGPISIEYCGIKGKGRWEKISQIPNKIMADAGASSISLGLYQYTSE
jgi:hypothetical protein